VNKVIVIYGPTAVGKSAIAVELAKIIDGEIISADSMQIYKGLDIGSAKVTLDEMQGIKHHLIDIKEPSEDYSVAEFCENAKRIIPEIISRCKTPIIVGGTGLYLKSLISNYDFDNTEKSQIFRNSLKGLSNEEIYNKIIELDPNAEIDINNRHRLIRKLEKLTMPTKQSQNSKNDFEYILFAIYDDRQKIYDRINARVDKMVENGLLQEAKYLLSLNLSEDNLAMKAIGYKELFGYLRGECTLEQSKELLKQKTRNYAKRQFTFMNQFPNRIDVDFAGVKQTSLNIAKIIGEN